MGQKKIIKKIIKKYGFELHTVRLNRPVHLRKKILRRINNNQPALSWNELRNHALKQGKEYWVSVIENISPNSWNELQLLARIIAHHIHDHNIFEQLLAHHDPLLSLPRMQDNEKHFIGKGAGTGSLQVYRKVVVENAPCFEKIYRNESLGLRKNQWFYTAINPHLDSSVIQAPKLIHVCRGKKLTALYFEYIDIALPTKAEALEITANKSKYFHALDQTVYATAPSIFYNFAISYGYSSGVAGILRMFDSDRIKFETFRLMEETVKKNKKCFCHGDLSVVNLSSQNHVIDFDESGIYPFGFDIAKVLIGYLQPKSVDEIKLYIENQFKTFVDTTEWEEFLFATCLFSFVFSSKDGKNSDLKKELFEMLTVLHKEILNKRQ